ncbi:MAG: cytochrome C [Acidobacteria bacterium]|nr:MAG: cytochrome C [Acidobacteriota bacterium]
MSQIFKPSTNTLARVSMFGAIFFLAILAWVLVTLNRSSLATRQGIVLQQPVPFSHDHHVAGLGISCLYCHTTVEESSFAGIPPSATCMNCHKLIWNESPMLEPVRESYRTGRPIEWTRVHDLPDFVYFDHSIHVAKGIGCASCHGRVDQMPLMYQAESLQMEWCLECHRAPEMFIRPRTEIYNMEWVSTDQETEGARLIADYRVQSKLSCSVCHR